MDPLPHLQDHLPGIDLPPLGIRVYRVRVPVEVPAPVTPWYDSAWWCLLSALFGALAGAFGMLLYERDRADGHTGRPPVPPPPPVLAAPAGERIPPVWPPLPTTPED